MAFHRLVVPTYYGGLPGGYDYINSPSLNGDPGSDAFADSKKGSGPNQGTYFVAFGEDATSADANRGFKALSENTDFLDNLLHRDIAITSRTADVTAGAPVSSIVLSGQIFVGEFGIANNQANRDLLVSILDNNDNEIITSAGVTVKASLIHDGALNNVVGTQSSGFFTAPTVALNVAIPTGTTYRVYYGERTNLASLPKDAFTNIKIRGAQEVSGEVERVLRDLHNVSGTTWNDPWTATIASLALTGLDGRYRLASTSAPALAVDTPGNGGFIVRDGGAVEFRGPTYLLDTVGTVGVDKYPDPIFAMMRLKRVSPVSGTTYDLTRGGDVGIVQESPYHNTSDANEVASGHVTGPLLLDMIPRQVIANSIGGGNSFTRINPAAVATANPDALTDSTSRRTLQVGGSDFVKDGSNRTGLRRSDLIEVTNNATGQVVGTYRVDSILSTTRVTVKALTGANPPIGPSGASASVRLRWLQPTVSIGGTHRAATDNQGTPHFFVAAPGALHSAYDANAIVPYAAFMSALSRRDLGITNQFVLQAMAWGGFDLDGTLSYKGFLYGDGGIVTAGGKQRLSMNSTVVQTFTVANGGGSVSWDPLTGGHVIIRPTTNWTTNPSPITFAIDTTKGYIAEPGDKFRLDIIIPSGTPAVSMTWPGTFVFSDSDGVLPLNVGAIVSETVVVSYQFTYITFSTPFVGTAWLATRTDYSM
jgi:hypothetical protein